MGGTGQELKGNIIVELCLMLGQRRIGILCSLEGPKLFITKVDLRMYYHSFHPKFGKYAVGMARSRDGIKWVKLGKIIGGGTEGSFDEFGVKNINVVKKRNGGCLMMAYVGVAADGQKSIGLAESIDGLKDWRRCENGAVLKPKKENNED